MFLNINNREDYFLKKILNSNWEKLRFFTGYFNSDHNIPAMP